MSAADAIVVKCSDEEVNLSPPNFQKSFANTWLDLKSLLLYLRFPLIIKVDFRGKRKRDSLGFTWSVCPELRTRMRGWWSNSQGLSQVSGLAVNDWFVKLLFNKVWVYWTVKGESLLSFFFFFFYIIELYYALCEVIFCSFKFKLLCSRCYYFFITFKVCWVLLYPPVLECGVG